MTFWSNAFSKNDKSVILSVLKSYSIYDFKVFGGQNIRYKNCFENSYIDKPFIKLCLFRKKIKKG